MTTMPSPTPPSTGTPIGASASLAAAVAQYRLLLRQQLTRGRVFLAGAMGGVAVLAALADARDLSANPVAEAVEFLAVYGLGLTVPIVSLVLASSALGDLVDDETLVYLWLRPVARWTLALAAWLASTTVAVPFTVVPLTVAAAIGTQLDPTATAAVAASMGLGAVAYTGIFTLLGLVVRRALIWGMMYVFIWELFVARVGAGAARLSINTYPASVLSELTGVSLPLAERAPVYGWTVPVAVALVAVALTTWRLDRGTVA